MNLPLSKVSNSFKWGIVSRKGIQRGLPADSTYAVLSPGIPRTFKLRERIAGLKQYPAWLLRVTQQLAPYTMPLPLVLMYYLIYTSIMTVPFLGTFSDGMWCFGAHAILKASVMLPLALMFVRQCWFASMVPLLLVVGLIQPVLLAFLRSATPLSIGINSSTLSLVLNRAADPVVLTIPLSDIAAVQLRNLSYQGIEQTQVLEIYCSAPPDWPHHWEAAGNTLGLRTPWLYWDRATRDFPRDGEYTCIRIPLSLFDSEQGQRSFLLRLRDELEPGKISLDVSNELLLEDSSTYTSLWLSQLHTSSERLKERVLPAGHLLKSGEYKVKKVLGHGGCSVVYQAVTNALAGGDAAEKVAIKEFVLNASGGRTAKSAECSHILSEIDILRQLDFPSIVKFKDCFAEMGRVYLVLEALEGANLRQTVAEHGALTEKEIVDMSIQICDILSHLHSRTPPIVHRDLAPDNFMVDKQVVKLIDFNVATSLDGAMSGTVVGKHCFMAPEQFRGQFGVASDLYQLGATMFFLATGHDPEPLTQSDPGIELPQLSECFRSIVRKLTSLQIADRYANVEAVAQELLTLSHSKDNLERSGAANAVEVR